MFDRLTEIVEAELPAQLHRMETIDGLARLPVLHLLQHQVDASTSIDILHSGAWAPVAKRCHGRVEPRPKYVDHRR